VDDRRDGFVPSAKRTGRLADGIFTAPIDWRGFQRDVQSELDAMDLFVLPSLFGEGLPFVLLEAMSAGVPVVGTDVEGIPEVLRNEQDGAIVPPGDADALANAIRRIVDGDLDWQALRSSAFQRQITGYTDVTMAAGVAKVYSAVLQPRSAQ
jgi:glycosyltransferase involved in cell wall biosynthesis